MLVAFSLQDMQEVPGTSSEGTCYHCFAIGGTIGECPECAGKPWSEEFLEAKNEIEGPDKLLVPSSRVILRSGSRPQSADYFVSLNTTPQPHPVAPPK
jgi:hypothetical protein